jgi:hypothetical protein
MDDLLRLLRQLLDGATGLFAAVTAFVVALVALIKAMNELVKTIRKLQKERHVKPRILVALVILAKKPSLYVGLVALLVTGGIVYVRSSPMAIPISLTDIAMKGAFDEFNNKKYDEAIKRAAECTENFKPSADALQGQLEAAKYPSYPVGKVSEAQKQEIWNNGALNAVAACYWVEGRAYHAKGDLKQAKEVYLVCARYTYARIYDPPGDFFWSRSGDFLWSPSDDCAGRAQGIQ